MRLQTGIFIALTIAGCHSQRQSKDQIVKAWNDAALAGFFPMSPICEKVAGAAAVRLSSAQKKLGELSAIAQDLYPRDRPELESPANAICPENLPDVGTSDYGQQERRASDYAEKLESANANFATALGG